MQIVSLWDNSLTLHAIWRQFPYKVKSYFLAIIFNKQSAEIFIVILKKKCSFLPTTSSLGAGVGEGGGGEEWGLGWVVNFPYMA